MTKNTSFATSMYPFIRPLLFQLDPEKAHDWTLKSLAFSPRCIFPEPVSKPVKALGLTFNHPVGLAAGLDKNGAYLNGLDKLGFSFIEIGTVTPRPQPGNPKPRLFRLPQAGALINRLGFNNEGVDVLVRNVEKAGYKGILGINIGKNKDTSLDNAQADYCYCLEKIYNHASYATINISSPNTPDLRQLQQGDFFRDLLQALHAQRIKLAEQHQKMVPMLVKVSPDENDETLKYLTASILKLGFDGIIATNTTCERAAVSQLLHGQESGGLSGEPLEKAALETLRLLKAESGNALTLIGVGGITSPEAAVKKLQAGADLVQIYTGLIYQGPALVQQITRAL